MPYYIFDINKEIPQSGYRYLFDANIWLVVLDNVFWRKEFKPYTSFFNSIINKTHVDDATLAVPCLLLSEILRKLLWDIYFTEFISRNPQYTKDKNTYKKTYRPSADYVADLGAVTASIRQYHQKIEFISDNLEQYSCKDLIKKIPTNLDINDYLYTKMALAQGLVIVTHDTDFDVEDIHILTTQKSLLGLMPQI
jgi:predicted nucleic acid-binding protein